MAAQVLIPDGEKLGWRGGAAALSQLVMKMG